MPPVSRISSVPPLGASTVSSNPRLAKSTNPVPLTSTDSLEPPALLERTDSDSETFAVLASRVLVYAVATAFTCFGDGLADPLVPHAARPSAKPAPATTMVVRRMQLGLPVPRVHKPGDRPPRPQSST